MTSRHLLRADREWRTCSRTIESSPPETATKMDWPRRRSCRARMVRSTASMKSLTGPCYWLRRARQAELSWKESLASTEGNEENEGSRILGTQQSIQLLTNK